MRLIDADELAPLVKRLIEMAPTVEPVKHGRWIIDTKFGADVMSGEQMVICSVCGRGIFWGKQNYCPHCGARMDEEADHDDHL